MNSVVNHSPTKTFLEHVHELQVRLTWVVLAVVLCSGAAYTIHEQLLTIIQNPLNQTLYYTSPTGGFSFLLKLCLSVGFVLALPVILYHIFGFLGPLLKRKHRSVILTYTLWSFNLAVAGVLFAYFISLPAALHFLANFGGSGLESLITVDEYFSFALAYLASFAVLFQTPLLVLFINRIKPLKPSKMMGAQRYVILLSFVVGAILTPTPDPFNQLLMAAPAIVLYQVGIVLVLLVNRKKKRIATPAVIPTENNVSTKRVIDHESIASQPHILAAPLETAIPQPQVRRVSRKFFDIIPPPSESSASPRFAESA